MSNKRKKHYPWITTTLKTYADSRYLTLNVYSEYHHRLSDDGFAQIDIWTTGRYWIFTTGYHEQNPDAHVPERSNEKGVIPLDDDELAKWLDKLFFATEMTNE